MSSHAGAKTLSAVPEVVLPSKAVVANAVQFFKDIAVDATWEASNTIAVKPNSIIEGRSLHFTVDKQYANFFMFLDQMRISFDFQLLDKNNKPPGTDTKVAPIVNFPSGVISSVNLYLK